VSGYGSQLLGQAVEPRDMPSFIPDSSAASRASLDGYRTVNEVVVFPSSSDRISVLTVSGQPSPQESVETRGSGGTISP
jgi:hypothetical protein